MSNSLGNGGKSPEKGDPVYDLRFTTGARRVVFGTTVRMGHETGEGDGVCRTRIPVHRSPPSFIELLTQPVYLRLVEDQKRSGTPDLESPFLLLRFDFRFSWWFLYY